MKTEFIADIGLEVHAELQTQSKMFCSCPVVDSTEALPNTAVCPTCAGMPGTLPVVNEEAVRMALQVGLSLDCEINRTSQFARKNYFYPDLPKGFQISQYEFPLAEGGALPIRTQEGWLIVRIRRVHLEEDTAKLTHVHVENGEGYSLVDLNRAGIPLLEIVSEPDMHNIDQVRAYTRGLRRLLQYLEVNSGDLEKGVIRFEANVSLRPEGSPSLGTRVEIKNLNSFRSLTEAVTFEIERQAALLAKGGRVSQETLGWDELKQITFSQRTKEEANDYRYFPEPDLPPLVVNDKQISEVRLRLPERPDRRYQRFVVDLGLDSYHAQCLIEDKAVADYFEVTLSHMRQPGPNLAANWILGELFGLLNAVGKNIDEIHLMPGNLALLLDQLQSAKINIPTAKAVLAKIFDTREKPEEVIQQDSLEQISNREELEKIVDTVFQEHPEEWKAFRAGKIVLGSWFFGQVMQQTGGKANPVIVQELLEEKRHGE